MRILLLLWDLAWLVGGVFYILSGHEIVGVIMISAIKITMTIEELMKDR